MGGETLCCFRHNGKQEHKQAWCKLGNERDQVFSTTLRDNESMPVETARGWDLHDPFKESSHRSTAVLGIKLQSKFTRDKPCADCSVDVRTNATAMMAELVRWLSV